MKKASLNLSTPCPACQSALNLVALGCDQCGCEVRGAVSLSPLAKLDSEMTHFLMVFVHCGGKISDVEKALGISYPTVKAKLASLQSLLSPEQESVEVEEDQVQDPIMKTLFSFESGEIGYEEMMKQIRKIKEKK